MPVGAPHSAPPISVLIAGMQQVFAAGQGRSHAVSAGTSVAFSRVVCVVILVDRHAFTFMGLPGHSSVSKCDRLL